MHSLNKTVYNAKCWKPACPECPSDITTATKSAAGSHVAGMLQQGTEMLPLLPSRGRPCAAACACVGGSATCPTTFTTTLRSWDLRPTWDLLPTWLRCTPAPQPRPWGCLYMVLLWLVLPPDVFDLCSETAGNMVIYRNERRWILNLNSIWLRLNNFR